MPVARVNDIELNYKLEGDGEETIVLINGLADDLETWAFQMDDFLAAGHRVRHGSGQRHHLEWTKFRRQGIRKNPWLWVVSPVLGVIVLAIPVWGDLRPGQPSPYNILPWLTLGLIAVGVVYALVLATWRPDVLERAPALLEGEESLATDPLPIGGLA
jgi:hypothetical protein